MTLLKRNAAPSLPQIFDDFFTRNLSNWGFNNHSSTNTSLPAVNLIETKDAFQVEMAAPGMDKKDFKIELEDEILTISSEKTLEKNFDEEEQFTRREFSYQSFQRTFHLSKKVVEVDKIKASYKNGILHISIPKKEEAKSLPPRQIAVQ